MGRPQHGAHHRPDDRPLPGPALEAQNRPFALLYLRTTEGMRDANNAGEFSDPQFWDTGSSRPSPATTWTPTPPGSAATCARSTRPGGSPSGPTPTKLTCTQLIYLGINAHVNNDLAFMIEEMGPRYTYPDHKHVDDVLAFRTRPVVYPEIQRELCPGLFSETVPPGADADIFAWRQLAWDNAQRLLAAPPAKARDTIAREIRQHAKDKAREILRWYR